MNHRPILVLLSLMVILAGCSSPQPTPSSTPVEPRFTPYVSPTASLPAARTPRVAPTTAANPRPVIIDSDLAADDWMAMLYLLQRTDISVLAITVAGTGEAHCGPGVKNALGLAALSGRAGINAACGRETPLSGTRTFPSGWRSGVDSLMGMTLPSGKNNWQGTDAVKLLESALMGSPEPVALLTLGPLTNIAELVQNAPAAARKISKIYVMGGAVRVDGNLGRDVPANKAAEWNIYVDPRAAKIVFESGVPVAMIGLDATNKVPFTRDFYNRMEADHTSPEAAWVYTLVSRNRSFLSGGYYFWDPLAAAILSDESLAAFESLAVCVVDEEGPQSGQTKEGPGCPKIQVAVNADGKRFEQVFLDALNNP